MPATLNAEERSISSPTPFPLLAALTARLMVAACVILPAVPVTVSVENPVGVQGDAERCSHALGNARHREADFSVETIHGADLDLADVDAALIEEFVSAVRGDQRKSGQG